MKKAYFGADKDGKSVIFYAEKIQIKAGVPAWLSVRHKLFKLICKLMKCRNVKLG